MNNLDLMKKRLEFQGGIQQENRMIKDKLKTLRKALLYSYQACTVQKVQSFSQTLALEDTTSSFPFLRALINPDKVKQDYDEKIISIEYDNLRPGDVFEWKKTDTYWLVYLREITEDAYFRSAIRRCRYKIKFKGSDGKPCETWAAIRGPVETQINSIQKNQIRIDQPNLSLNILMPKNDETVKAFERYSEFLFAGRAWRVEAPDSISMEDILEINAEEYYISPTKDDVINEIANGLVIEKVDPTPNSEIQGETFIIPRVEARYTAPAAGGKWYAKSEVGAIVPVSICPIDDLVVTVTWNKATHGNFVLYWTDGSRTIEKSIVVESLF